VKRRLCVSFYESLRLRRKPDAHKARTVPNSATDTGSGTALIVPLRLKAWPAALAVIVVAISRLKGCPGAAHPVDRDVASVGPDIVRLGVVPHNNAPRTGWSGEVKGGLTARLVA
jgi:hypothetical protein